jgi:agmatine deiminase
MDEREIRQQLHDNPVNVELTRADAIPLAAPDESVRLPAQWEPVETVLLTWPVLYPPLWTLYAELVAAILPVAAVTILVPRPTWASGIRLYLQQRDQAAQNQLRFVNLPTDDIWVRDYGPMIGFNPAGERVAVYARYGPLPNYPQDADDAMPERWAAHEKIPARPLSLYTEGGNLWSDGAGTLMMSDGYRRHPALTQSALEQQLHAVFDFDKLIIVPHLDEEETGHIDLILKLADAQTVLVTAPGQSINADNLAAAARILSETTNAREQRYDVVELPALRPYFNWGVYPIWRSYTNALTVNRRVLVPVYGEQDDDTALAIYQQAMPDFEVISINCRTVINGGGAVHCLTKEVPMFTK